MSNQQAQVPPTTFHQVKIKVGQRDEMPIMLHEQVGTGTQGDREITVARNISGSLLLLAVGKSNYIVDVADIVQGLIDFEDGNGTV
jgi:hypothetical protein